MVVSMSYKCKKAGQPKHRAKMGHEGHVGQAWNRKKVPAEGETKFGKKIIVMVDAGHFRCHCGAIVRIDRNSFACCEACGEIYNDGPAAAPGRSNRQKKASFERFKYQCCHMDM